MGSRGPVPKRSDQRRRRNRESTPEVVQVDRSGDVDVPNVRTQLCARARHFYESLAESGQSQFYEPSDWQMALLAAEAIDAFMQRPSAMMLSAIDTLTGKLLATEGDRRRMRLELTAAAGGDPDQGDADVLDMDGWRALLDEQ